MIYATNNNNFQGGFDPYVASALGPYPVNAVRKVRKKQKVSETRIEPQSGNIGHSTPSPPNKHLEAFLMEYTRKGLKNGSASPRQKFPAIKS